MGEGDSPRDQRAGAYRPSTPEGDALIEWPDDFGTRFSVFVDTEEEFDWSLPLSRDARSVTAIAGLPDTHARFADRGVALTYLVDHPVASDPAAVETIARLIEDGRSAVGTQLHPWVNPPFEEAVTPANSFVGNLPSSLEAAKLSELTGLIAARFGARPLIFRAGRYGIGPDTFALLAAEGYRIDTSMRAGYDYSPEGGPDFAAIGNPAFRGGPDGAIVELPLTTIYTGALRGSGVALYRRLGRVPRGRGVAARLGLLSRVALTPEDMPIGDAIEAVRVALGEGLRFLNFAFHSPSTVPGHTPYVRDAADLREFHRWWESMLDLLLRLGVLPASQAEIIAACDKAAPSAIAADAGGL